MINKGRAAFITILFFALVRPDSVPDMWIVSALTVMFYEIAFIGFNTFSDIRQERKQKEQEMQTYYHNRANGRRWKNTTMAWEMKEVNR